MNHWLITLIVSMVTFVACEFVWLQVVAKTFYRTRLDEIRAESYNLTAAILFYVIYNVGILYFAVAPVLRLDASDWPAAALTGGLYGFIGYSAYNLTNKAVLKQWPWLLVVVDTTWGTLLTGTVAAVGYSVLNHLS